MKDLRNPYTKADLRVILLDGHDVIATSQQQEPAPGGTIDGGGWDAN